MSNQDKWLLAFITFFVTFLGATGTLLVNHEALFKNSEIWGHLLLIVASSLAAMGAALRYQIPRDYNKDYADRVSDAKRAEINHNGSER